MAERRKRGQICNTGSEPRGWILAHRFPCHPAEHPITPDPENVQGWVLCRRGLVRFAAWMAGLVSSAGDRAYFLTLMHRQLNSAVHRRMNVLLLLDDGWSAERIAEALFIEAETVWDHHRRYISDGRGGIEHLAYVGSAPVLSAVQRAALEAELGARLYMSAKEVCDYVARQFGLTYTPHAMAKLLKRLNFVWKRPKRVPAKADPLAQRTFLEPTLAPLMAQAAADPASRSTSWMQPTRPITRTRPAAGSARARRAR